MDKFLAEVDIYYKKSRQNLSNKDKLLCKVDRFPINQWHILQANGQAPIKDVLISVNGIFLLDFVYGIICLVSNILDLVWCLTD